MQVKSCIWAIPVFFLNLELLRILTTHVASPHPAFIHIWIFEEASSIFWEHAVNERKIEVHTPLRIMILKIGIFGGFFFGGGVKILDKSALPTFKKRCYLPADLIFLAYQLIIKDIFLHTGGRNMPP